MIWTGGSNYLPLGPYKPSTPGSTLLSPAVGWLTPCWNPTCLIFATWSQILSLWKFHLSGVPQILRSPPQSPTTKHERQEPSFVWSITWDQFFISNPTRSWHTQKSPQQSIWKMKILCNACSSIGTTKPKSQVLKLCPYVLCLSNFSFIWCYKSPTGVQCCTTYFLLWSLPTSLQLVDQQLPWQMCWKAEWPEHLCECAAWWILITSQTLIGWSMLVFGYSRSFLPPCDDESIPKSGVHGEDRTAVRLRYHPHQEVLPPDIYISIYSTSERQVVLDKKNTDLL